MIPAPSRVSTVAALAVLVLAGPAVAEEIRDIVVEENSKTTDETVILIADLEVGDSWDSSSADRVKVDLVSSGLFKDVEVFTAPVDGGVQVHIVARDKHSWVVAPAFYWQPTNKGGGVGFGENNLFGENEKLLLYGQVATGDSFFVGAYVDPAIAGSRFHWQYDLYLKSGRVFEYAVPTAYKFDPRPVRTSRLNYLNTGARLGVDLWKLSLDGRLRGAWVSYGKVELNDGATIADVTGDPGSTAVPVPGAEGWDVSTELSLTYDDRANWYGLSTGDRYKASFEHALPALGSDFDYWYGTVRAERARKFLERHNLVAKASLGYGRRLPFQQEFTAGGTAMRGWKNAQFRGNLQATANVEYSVPVFTVSGLGLRALAFWDSSYTTFTRATDGVRDYLPNATNHGLAPLKNSVGLGTRLYLRQVVLPLLGLDFGYGVERGDLEMYIAIGLTD